MAILLVYPAVLVLVAVVIVVVRSTSRRPGAATGRTHRKWTGRKALGFAAGALGASVGMALVGLAGVGKRR
jgi:hypothetical protein